MQIPPFIKPVILLVTVLLARDNVPSRLARPVDARLHARVPTLHRVAVEEESAVLLEFCESGDVHDLTFRLRVGRSLADGC